MALTFNRIGGIMNRISKASALRMYKKYFAIVQKGNGHGHERWKEACDFVSTLNKLWEEDWPDEKSLWQLTRWHGRGKAKIQSLGL